MLIQYNGIRLSVVKMEDWSKEPVYTSDGADILFAKHTIGVRCVFNPDATGSPNFPGESWRTLEKALESNRQKLYVIDGGFTVLESPQKINGKEPGVDAYLGPKVLLAKVREVHGLKTYIVDFRVETWVVPGNGNGSALIGHRWSMVQRYDEQFLETRTISGEISLRSDVLAVTALRPDNFRESVFHPIQDGFQRTDVTVEAVSDNTRLTYSFTDSEQWLSRNLLNPITKLQGFYRVENNNIGGDPNVLFSGKAPSIFPILTRSISVEAWGRRFAGGRIAVVQSAAAALMAYGFNVELGNIPRMCACSVVVDIVGMYCKWEGTTVFQGAGCLFEGIFDKIKNPGELPDDIIADNGAGQVVTLATFAPRQNPRPPGASGTRGDYLIACLSQALTDPFGLPAAPTQFPASKDVKRN